MNATHDPAPAARSAVSDTPTPSADPQAIAEAVRDAMWTSDRASQALGMRVVAIGPDSATLTMAVRPDMINGHGSCHGGLITTLADSAFAFACNAANEVTVASGISIDLVAPAREGDVLTAHCTARHRSGRTGVFDCEVRNQHGTCIALFRGHSYTARGRPVVEGLPMPLARPRGTASNH